MSAVASFEQHVLPWLQERCPEAVAVERVSGSGTDMAGDTEDGFYSKFGVSIAYRDATGGKRFHQVEGDEMESLWNHAVGGWASGQR